MPRGQFQEKTVMQMANLLTKMEPPMCMDSICYLTSSSRKWFTHYRRQQLNLSTKRGTLKVASFSESIDDLIREWCGCSNNCNQISPNSLASHRQAGLFCVSAYWCFVLFTWINCTYDSGVLRFENVESEKCASYKAASSSRQAFVHQILGAPCERESTQGTRNSRPDQWAYIWRSRCHWRPFFSTPADWPWWQHCHFFGTSKEDSLML